MSYELKYYFNDLGAIMKLFVISLLVCASSAFAERIHVVKAGGGMGASTILDDVPAKITKPSISSTSRVAGGPAAGTDKQYHIAKGTGGASASGYVELKDIPK